MDPQEKGDFTEALGFAALHELKNMHGDFVLTIHRSSPELDARGIDCLVEIRLPSDSEKRTMTVPIEFKSSAQGVEKWKVVHSDLYKAGVLVFALPHEMSRRNRRRLMYRALKRVQLNSLDGTLYHSMFQMLFRGGSRNLWRNIKLIRKRRAQERSRKK